MAVFPFINLTNQWTDGEEINAAKMFARVDTQLNALANASFNPPRFKGSIKTATAVPSTTNIAYPVVFDTASGWNSSTHAYVCPLAGTYLAFGQMKWGAVTPGALSLAFMINGTQVTVSPNPPNANNSGPALSTTVTMAVGDSFAAQLSTGFTTFAETGDNNYLNLYWTGV